MPSQVYFGGLISRTDCDDLAEEEVMAMTTKQINFDAQLVSELMVFARLYHYELQRLQQNAALQVYRRGAVLDRGPSAGDRTDRACRAAASRGEYPGVKPDEEDATRPPNSARKEVIPMAQTLYIVMKVQDGKTILTGVTEDPTLTVVRALQDAVEEMARQIAAEAWESQQPRNAEVSTKIIAETGETPTCGVHNVSMVWVDKNGGFWSCHDRNTDGSWCKYRPPRS
jgi:hypothetical protein